MSIEVEINLRIPRVKVPVVDEKGYPIDNTYVRFTKLVQVPRIPKPGESLALTTSAGHMFRGTVVRAEWHEDRALFVLDCRYASRSMPSEECAALFSAPDWKTKLLS